MKPEAQIYFGIAKINIGSASTEQHVHIMIDDFSSLGRQTDQGVGASLIFGRVCVKNDLKKTL